MSPDRASLGTSRSSVPGVLRGVFGEELARWPETSLPSKVAQGCGLLPVDSAGETVGVVSEVTGEEKIRGNGSEGTFNNDMADDEMFFEKTRNNSQYLSHTCGHV